MNFIKRPSPSNHPSVHFPDLRSSRVIRIWPIPDQGYVGALVSDRILENDPLIANYLKLQILYPLSVFNKGSTKVIVKRTQSGPWPSHGLVQMFLAGPTTLPVDPYTNHGKNIIKWQAEVFNLISILNHLKPCHFFLAHPIFPPPTNINLCNCIQMLYFSDQWPYRYSRWSYQEWVGPKHHGFF